MVIWVETTLQIFDGGCLEGGNRENEECEFKGDSINQSCAKFFWEARHMNVV